jgi:ectoine hydroxylase-related dioxygenase (phytanoyl-CoA dioxygenase family)
VPTANSVGVCGEQVMINDQQPDQGNTSVVYGSHKMLNGPDSLGNWRGGSSGGANGKQAAHEMPNHEQFVGQAGDALLFDIRTYHAGAPTPSAN